MTPLPNDLESRMRAPCLPITCLLLGLAAPAGASERYLGTETLADLVERAAPAVVNIDTVSRRENPAAQMDPFFHRFFGDDLHRLPSTLEQKGVGSGFLIAKDGLIVSNRHVIRDATTIQVTLADGRKFAGRVVGADPGSDLALIRIDGKGFPTLPFAGSRRLRVGQYVVAIGSPLGLSTTVTSGIVSALDREVAISERVSFIQTDAPINPGNSGGPLLNLDGQVIGVNTAIAARAQGIGFAIPVETVKMVVDQLRRNGKVERPWLGLVVSEAISHHPEGGVQISDLADGGPAAKAGLLEGDLILQVEGRPIVSASDLIHRVAQHRVGTTLHLTIHRDGQRRMVAVVLSPMPEPPPEEPGPDEE